MWKASMFVVVFSSVAVTALWNSVPDQVHSPKQVVEQFCKMDAEGRFLSPEDWSELTGMVNYRVLGSGPDITIIKTYAVGDPVVRGDSARVDVRFEVWGTLYVSSLRFVREEGMTSGEPVKKDKGFALSFSEKYMEIRKGGEQVEGKGSPRWTFGEPFIHPHISLETAVRYLIAQRDETNDPALKANAQKSLAALRAIVAGAPEPLGNVGASVESPAHVLGRFTDLEKEGRGLTLDGWRELAGFFVKPPKKQWHNILIVEEVRYGDSMIEGNEAQLVANYVPRGALDSSLRLLHEEELKNSTCCAENGLDYILVFSDKHWESAPDGTAKEVIGPPAWRIEEYPSEPWLTVEAAIRYVTDKRNETSDPTIKTNADKTLAALERSPKR